MHAGAGFRVDHILGWGSLIFGEAMFSTKVVCDHMVVYGCAQDTYIL